MATFDNTFWERITGYVTELRVDSRWILRDENDDPLGNLRIVSHPDLPPGHLRAIFIYIVSKTPKTIEEQLKTVEDYLIDVTELEVYSIDNQIETDKKIYEAPFKELEEIFNVKVFE